MAKKLTDRQLILLGTMAKHQLMYGGNMRYSWGNSPDSLGNFYKFPEWTIFDEKKFPIRVTLNDINALTDRQREPRLLEYADKQKLAKKITEQGFEPKNLGSYSKVTPMGPTKAAHELLKEEEERYNRLIAEIEAREDNPRFLVSKMGSQNYSNLSWQKTILPGAGHLYIIKGETPKNYLVEPYEAPKNYSDSDVFLVGRPGKYTIPKEHVLMTDVTPTQFVAMKQATRDFMESVARAEGQAREEEEAVLAPIRARLAQRKEQLIAMLEDGLKEAINPEEGPKP